MESDKTIRSARAVEMNATIPVAELTVDHDGNLIIKNRELGQKVQAFLNSEEGRKLEAKQLHLLCCVLRPPKPPKATE